MKKVISLIMPTYNRDFIIKLAITSIVNQIDHNWKIELLIGDDGEDDTESVVRNINNINPLLSIHYFKLNRISISDKVNYLINKSIGSFYGLIGSDDIQSPFKISSFEKAILQNPNAEVFGQRSFIYHDIIINKSNIWTQNKSLDFFKAGSFILIKRSLFDKVGGYPKGLWKRVDGTFYKKIKPLKPIICDVSKFDERVINTSIALQHIDNIWDRSAKGLQKNKPKQLANFYAEPVIVNVKNIIKEYDEVRKDLLKITREKYCIPPNDDIDYSNLKILKILIVVSLDMRKKDGASNLRPAQIIDAFRNTNHEINVIDAPNRKRHKINILKNILKSISTGTRYDICYFEPSTYPINNFEKLLIKVLKLRNTWISYFHRDMYWRYQIGADKLSTKKFQTHKIKQEANLKFLENNIDLIFTPSISYAKELKSSLKSLPLPPGGELRQIEYNPYKRKGIIYAGGISERYGSELLLESFEVLNKENDIPLTIVCRAYSDIFDKYKKYKWLTIKNLNNEELQAQYKNFRMGIIPIQKLEYHEFAIPFKLFQYSSHGLPILATDNFEQINLIDKNEIGFNIGSTVESFCNSIKEYYFNFNLLSQYHQNSIKFMKNNGLWNHRVEKIIHQYRESNG